AEDGIRDWSVTGVQTCALPIWVLAYLAINSDAKQGKIDTKAQMLVTVSWPDDHPDDIDTYVEDPQGNIVWYHVMEAGLMSLDRRSEERRVGKEWRSRRLLIGLK